MVARIALEGLRFGRLTAIEMVPVQKGVTFYSCKCDCGNELNVRSVSLRKGDTQSCGCFRQEKMRNAKTTHGLYGSPTYLSWRAMIARCTDSTHRQFKDYGGRGISISPDWIQSFERFLSDVGPRPAGKTLDRKDSNGNYCPGNCKWSTPTEQNANKREKFQPTESTK